MQTQHAKNVQEAGDVRVAFLAPESLVKSFGDLAKTRERTLSAELRKLMADELKRAA